LRRRPLVLGSASGLLVDLVGLGIYAVAVAAIVGWVFQQPLTGFWATSGVLGVVLGFALRDMVLDLFTGVAVNIDQPYRLADWIELRILGQAYVGRVVEMNWRTTCLETEEHNIVVVPNSLLAPAVVTNYGAPPSHTVAKSA
jgi:small-conductance mechanosensitive channel